MKANLYWIERPRPGRLAILARPRGGDWLEDEILSLKKAGVNILVSALTPEETSELELDYESGLCRQHGIEFVSFPIEDRDVPPSMKMTRELVQVLERSLLEAKSVAIHCRQGIGRSSMLAACVLVLEEVDSETAFDTIRRAARLSRPGHRRTKTMGRTVRKGIREVAGKNVMLLWAVICFLTPVRLMIARRDVILNILSTAPCRSSVDVPALTCPFSSLQE